MWKVFSFLLLAGCAGTWVPGPGFEHLVVPADGYEIATYQRMTNKNAPIHIYVEGDGRAFNAYGEPTDNPTPHGKMMRNLAMRDTAENVVYMARPCQFIMSDVCSVSDWTDGRFSAKLVDAMAGAVKKVAAGRPVILVGYSGGAMMTGLIIARNPDIRVKKWVTIAGVLNHNKWTQHFGDSPLTKSLNLEELPDVPAIHYVGARDRVVPPDLARAIIGGSGNIVVIPGAAHDDFEYLDIDFN